MLGSNARVLAVAAEPLILLLAPAVAFATPPNPAIAVDFLSADGAPLADDFAVDSEAPTFFVVHGFRSEGTSSANLRQADAIRRRSPRANVIIVAWHVPPEPRPESVLDADLWQCAREKTGCSSHRSQKPCDGESVLTEALKCLDTIACELIAIDSHYRRSAAAAQEIGDRIAAWMKSTGARPSRTVISGHSLGAQIAAFASNACARPELFDEPVATIIAADPAGPLFEDRPPDWRLDRGDAVRVFVVHSTRMWGDENPIGTVDVYASWPESNRPDSLWRHNAARELVTHSLQPESPGPRAVSLLPSALHFDLGVGEPRDGLPDIPPGGVLTSNEPERERNTARPILAQEQSAAPVEGPRGEGYDEGRPCVLEETFCLRFSTRFSQIGGER